MWLWWLQDGELLVVDPDSTEEAAAAGLMTVVVNTHSDVCTVRKTSGIGISMTQVHSPCDTAIPEICTLPLLKVQPCSHFQLTTGVGLACTVLLMALAVGHSEGRLTLTARTVRRCTEWCVWQTAGQGR